MIVVVGAGAAGLVAAIHARVGTTRVVVLESTADGGRKILISGGGRCNVLPVALEPERFVTDSPAPLVRRLLRSWPLHEQRAFFERDVGVPLHVEEDTRKIFPDSHRARDVRDGLVALARRAGAEFRFQTKATGVMAAGPHGWRVLTNSDPIEATHVIVATGGLSVPATGSDGVGLTMARELGHTVHQTYPALTPLVDDGHRHAALSGISLEVRLRARWGGRMRETDGGFLFTHRGYSGPAVLDLSHEAVRSGLSGDERAVYRVQWSGVDSAAWGRVFSGSAARVLTVIGRELPARLAEQLMIEAGVPLDRRTADLARTERAALVDGLTSYVLPWTGDEGYRKAEVTGGGVALDEIDSRTMESRRHRGVFFCGEVLDAFGPIGGHNFAWAWATGRLAGLGAVHAASVSPSGGS